MSAHTTIRSLTLAGLATLSILAGGLALAAVPSVAAVLPEVTTAGTSGVTATSATLEGVVNPGGETVTNCQFEYGTSNGYGHAVSCTPAPGGGSAPVNVSAAITGLEQHETYHYRVSATNVNGTVEGSDGTFTTETIRPVIGAQLPPASITRTTAVVSAKINPEGAATTYRVLYGVTSDYGEHTIDIDAGNGSAEETVDATLTGLTPGTTYHYAFVASNRAIGVTGPDQTFTTPPATPPTATTGGASNVTLTGATVAATVETQGLETSYELDLGIDTTYATRIYGEAGSDLGSIEIAVSLQNLAPSTTYHYRFVSINSDGRSYGADRTFTTPVYSKPIVLPGVAPLLQTPAIAFPAESGTPVVKKVTKKKATKKKKGKGHGKPRKKTKRKKK
jgi:phosphodiesterase/alkaline phosphatase D-like protein